MSDITKPEPSQDQEVALNAFFDLLHPALEETTTWNIDEDGDISLIDTRTGRTVILLEDGVAIVFNREEEEEDGIVLHDFFSWENPVELTERCAAVLGLRLRPDLEDYLETLAADEDEEGEPASA